MPENVHPNRGKQFASDLSRIRKQRGVSIDALHEETKIPQGLISSFEENGLFDHPIFNRVYLRSFVRTFARTVDISPALALKALDEALEGSYEGRLAQEYLGGAEEEQIAAEAPEESAEEAAAVEAPAEPVAEEQVEEEQAPAEPAAPEPPKEEIQHQRASGKEEQQAEAAPASAASGASAAAEGGERSHKRQKRRSVETTSSQRQWIFLGAVLVIIALGGWLLVSLMGGEGGTAEDAAQEPQAAVEDTAAAETAQPGPPDQPAEPVDVGENLDLTVTAAQGPIRELRVKEDDDLRRPYWIEAGADTTFQAQNRIVFGPPLDATGEQPLDMMSLQLEGRDYPTDRRNSQGEIVITRASAQAYLDSLASQQ